MKRQYQALVVEYLALFPCVVIVGARQTGKSTLMNMVAAERPLFDLESRADYLQIAEDPELFLRFNQQPLAIDEAQLLPELFPALRVAIDRDRHNRGKYLLSGSSSPYLLNVISESLAGRVGIIEISPFSYAETRNIEQPNLLKLFRSDATATSLLREWASYPPQEDNDSLTRYWYEGGYPEPWTENKDRFSEIWKEQYLNTYLERDVARLFPKLNSVRFRRFIELLAGCSGAIINYSNIANILDVSQPTARDYFDIAHGTFIWRTIPAYSKTTGKRVSKHPRGYLRDSGLLHHLLQVPSLGKLLSHPQMGASWEGLVIEEILRCLNAAGIEHSAYYYRTSGGAEVDLILEGKFGLIPVEIKHTQSVNPRHLRGIRDFITDFGCPFGLVVNNDEKVRLYDEKLLGAPFSLLTGGPPANYSR
ncbi:MAG: ATP-binding protein [Halieaceae bacterium]|nr:ATP-binding protein [Halieaceae bacterium]